MLNLEPPHPGLLVRRECLDIWALTVTEAARILGVTRQALNNVVNGKSGVSPEMAIRLDKAFGGGAEGWLQHQLAYELAQARKRAHTFEVQSMADQRQEDSQQRLFR